MKKLLEAMIRSLSDLLIIARTAFVLRNVNYGKKVRVHGKLAVRALGYIEIGDGTCFHFGRNETELSAHGGAKLKFGKGCYINNACVFNASESIVVGDRAHIGYGVIVLDSHLHGEAVSKRNERPIPQAVTIGDDVWLGSRAIIMPGVTIGGGSIVAAASVVTRSVPPLTIVAGNPARVIRAVSEEKEDIRAMRIAIG